MKKYFIAIMLLLLASLSSLRAEDKPVILHPSSTTHGAGQGKKPRKPAHCPNWVPDTPDGDDSDYTKGPLDENGFPADIPSMISDSIIYITQDTEWSLRKYVYHKVYVYGQKTLRITNDINFYRGTGIYLASGSKLIVDGGSLIDVSINFVGTSGTSIEIIHDGSIKTLDSQDFAVPLGVSLIVQNGKIE